MKLSFNFLLSSFFILPTFIDAKNQYYPDNNWEQVTPESQGIDKVKIEKLLDLSFLDAATQGVVIIKNGKIISWYLMVYGKKLLCCLDWHLFGEWRNS
jgi:hypothetical protein